MFHKIEELQALRGKSVAIATIDNKFYYGVLNAITGTQIEIAFPRRYVEYIYKSAIRCLADDMNEIKCPDGMFWIL